MDAKRYKDLDILTNVSEIRKNEKIVLAIFAGVWYTGKTKALHGKAAFMVKI